MAEVYRLHCDVHFIGTCLSLGADVEEKLPFQGRLSGPCGCTERKGIRVFLVPFRVISGFRFV